MLSRLAALNHTSAWEKKMKHRWILSALLLSSCAGYRSLEKQPSMANQYHAGFQETVAASRDALVASGFKIDKERTSGGDTTTFHAHLGASWQSWGQVLKLQVIAGDSISTVRIVNRPKVSINVTEDTYTPYRNITARIKATIETRKVKDNALF
jgi:hypothetical protein